MEQTYGVVKVDYAGRFVIPAKLRNEMGLDHGGIFEVVADSERIILVKKQGVCVVCGKVNDDLTKHLDKHFCNECWSSIAQELGE